MALDLRLPDPAHHLRPVRHHAAVRLAAFSGLHHQCGSGAGRLPGMCSLVLFHTSVPSRMLKGLYSEEVALDRTPRPVATVASTRGTQRHEPNLTPSIRLQNFFVGFIHPFEQPLFIPSRGCSLK